MMHGQKNIKLNSLWITPCQSKKITNMVFTRDNRLIESRPGTPLSFSPSIRAETQYVEKPRALLSTFFTVLYSLLAYQLTSPNR